MSDLEKRVATLEKTVDGNRLEIASLSLTVAELKHALRQLQSEQAGYYYVEEPDYGQTPTIN